MHHLPDWAYIAGTYLALGVIFGSLGAALAMIVRSL